jgi:hypothetical protein
MEFAIINQIDLASLGELAADDREAQAIAQEKATKDAFATDLRQLSAVIDASIKGERMVLGADYADLNKAVAALTRAGLEVRNRNEEIVTGS